VTSNKNPSKKHLQNFPTEKPRKGSKITKKGKREEHNQALRNHAESSIHTMKGSYKVASSRSSFSLTRSQHEALKIVLEILMKIGRENRKTK
jgi:hypothetical protein